MASVIHALFMYIFCYHVAIGDDSPVVNVKQGSLKGLKKTSVYDIPYYAFVGIPYAKPPVGERRFKAPEPYDSWNGTYEAITIRDMCPQIPMGYGGYQGDEDCLYLNVYTNQLPKDEEDVRPVMVWIHGGAFQKGSSHPIMYGPDFLLKEDIVFVSIQYRLGILGFLSIPEENIPGNSGLKDQSQALKWIQENIDKFGGNPRNVTIFGESAGAASVHYHLLSHMSQGLFSNAISQSGSSLNSWAYSKPEDLNELAVQLASKLGYNATTSAAIHQGLRNASAETLITATENLQKKFLPTHEVESSNGEKAFLTNTPESLVYEGKFHNVPYITGSNKYESSLFFDKNLPIKKEAVDNYVKYLHFFYNKLQQVEESKQKSIKQQVMDVYFKNESNLDEGYLNVLTDVLFLIGIDRTVKEHAVNSTKPVYYYYFQYDGELSLTKLMHVTMKKGPTHADEMGYIFKTFATPKMDDSEAMQMLKKIVKMWTNFAKTGNPTPQASDELLKVEWKPYTVENKEYLDINKDISMAQNLHPERLSVWKDLP
ncbi:hypothetical protein L9F63_018428 [Diploptera punctata]|uniref:Carboxylic ester hydrolase n=1 Tax=Diploptera punctata TaxID=6984 RepID=A0AAD8EFW3_DIPPU|nr:hypothetical protein L9F63_018428 [Diploptera punctata]